MPLNAFACWDFDEFRKPAPGMWDAVCELAARGGYDVGELRCCHPRDQRALKLRLRTDYEKSFYVGDAAGRSTDHADTDRSQFGTRDIRIILRSLTRSSRAEFAANAGLQFLTPEELFGGEEADPDWALWGWNPLAYNHTRELEALVTSVFDKQLTQNCTRSRELNRGAVNLVERTRKHRIASRGHVSR